MITQDSVSAARRVLSAYAAGVAPACADIWAIQLAVSTRDAADLLLGFEELARQIILRQSLLYNVPLQSAPTASVDLP